MDHPQRLEPPFSSPCFHVFIIFHLFFNVFSNCVFLFPFRENQKISRRVPLVKTSTLSCAKYHLGHVFNILFLRCALQFFLSWFSCKWSAKKLTCSSLVWRDAASLRLVASLVSFASWAPTLQPLLAMLAKRASRARAARSVQGRTPGAKNSIFMKLFRPRAKNTIITENLLPLNTRHYFHTVVGSPDPKTICSQKVLGSRMNNYERRFRAQVAPVAWRGLVPLIPTIQPTIELNFSTCRSLPTC